MKSFWGIVLLSAHLLTGYEITNTHLCAVATSVLWAIAPYKHHEETRFEYELSGMITAATAGLALATKNSRPLESTWSPSPGGIASLLVASFLVAIRTKSPLPYTLAALAIVHDFYKKDRAHPTLLIQKSSLKRDLNYWIGIALATGAFTCSKALAKSLYITRNATRGSMLALSAFFIAKAFEQQCVL
jgi:hypothetical protein